MTAAPVHYRRNSAHSRKEALLVRAALQIARVPGFTPSPVKPRLSLRGKPGYPCFTKKHTPWRKAALYEARTGMDPWVSPSHGEIQGMALVAGMGRIIPHMEHIPADFPAGINRHTGEPHLRLRECRPRRVAA